MPFKPIGERHAIQEVVFIVGFAHNFTPDVLERVVAHHSLWKSDLPKLERMNVIQIAFGDAPPDQAPPPAGPVVFKSFKRDGSLDWQLQVRDNWLAVNCLSYSRWDAVSRQAKSLLEKVLGLVIDESNLLSQISLQYIDTFVWDGDVQEYDIDLLVNRGSGFYADGFRPASKSWHYHQGEFEFPDAEPTHRILKRIHLDATEDQAGPKVKIDTVLRTEFENSGLPTLESIRGLVDLTLDDLHVKNKTILATLINQNAQDKISLNKGA
ncbi:TIGR04255 family protein [Novosphingobium profundi]|uniref:TIGR04255 family protein n=1 Tax=Novosphingobium profundi TaxID=1774954 RepID=UPI001BD9FD01|nr:TIGR04255 family protein [Novosphingobium profundi]MBT0670785.1 TIGR04255 family protein [Novosphingobium profundi]